MKIIVIIYGISLSNLKLVVCKFITKTRAPVLPEGQSLCSRVPVYHTFPFFPCRSETWCESLPSLWIPVLRSQQQSREVTVFVCWWFFFMNAGITTIEWIIHSWKWCLKKKSTLLLFLEIVNPVTFFLPFLWWNLAAAVTESRQVHLSES